MSEIGPDARSIVEGGRDGDDPTPADRARIRASVLGAIAAGGAASTATATAGAALAKTGGAVSFGWKIVGVIAVLGAGTGAVVTASMPSKPTAASAPALSAASPPSGEAAAITTSLPAASAAPLAPSASPSALPAAPSAEPTLVPIASAPRRAPIAAPSAPPSEPIYAVNEAPKAPPEDTLPAETRRLREAHGAMQGGDPARAIALLDEQSAAGPELRQERAAARVLALCQLGRIDEARTAAARFLQENPSSPIADRVRGSCAGR